MSGGNKDTRRFGRSGVTVKEALNRVLLHVRPVGVEAAPTAACFGRRAAEDVFASEPVPHFRRSGVDGYAIQSGSTIGAASQAPVTLRVVGSIPCGSTPSGGVAHDTAMRIMTGAMMPDGADAVVMLEMTEAETAGGEHYVTLKREIAPGANVSPVGSDVPEGTKVVERGTRLGPAEAALLATVGKPAVSVFRKPLVAIVSTGSELLSPAETLAPGKIRNSNAYMLAAQVISAGGEPVLLDIAADEMESVSRIVQDGLESYDTVITTGGVSVGDYDMMTDFLHEWEGSLLFNKIQMRPGSVTSAGVWQGKPLFALSGNPGACFAGFELFVRPALKAMQGCSAPEPVLWQATLAQPFTKKNAYPRYIRGRIWHENGVLFAAPLGMDQSSRMLPGLGADGFLIIPPGGNGMAGGERIHVMPFALQS